MKNEKHTKDETKPQNLKTMKPYVIGIDEVGRGPLAGPVAVGAVLMEQKDVHLFKNIKESKQLSSKRRKEWAIKMESDSGKTLRSAVSFVSAERIDEIGISPAIKEAIKEALAALTPSIEECMVLLDGGLSAPKEYIHQQTIIRGDENETIIAMASVVAKVARDELMIALDAKYPDYGFAKHKGYGTFGHILAIEAFGLSPLHRKSFCKNIVAE